MRFKFWLNIITFAAVGAVVTFGWRDIALAFDKMRSLDLWILALMVPIQFLVFFAIAKTYSNFFRIAGQKVPLRTLIAMSIELNFVNHIFPSGGVSGFSYFTLRLKHNSVSVVRSTMAQLVRYIFTFTTFISLLILALVLLALEGRASKMIILVATAITLGILFMSLGLIYIVGSEVRIRSFTRAAAAVINKLIHAVRHKNPEQISLAKTEQLFFELHKDFILIRKDLGKMWPIAGWALLANVAEIGVIYVVFVANGAWVNPGAVIVAYSLATLVGLLAILPGGLGIYEPLMAGTLLSAGVPADLAVSVTLVSRVAALGLALSTGYVLYQLALRRHARSSS